MPKKPSPAKRSALSRRLQRQVVSGVSTIWQGILQLGQHIAATIHRIRRRDQLLAILLLLIWIVLLLGNFYFRGVSRFEGTLTTQTMSFTYNDQANKLFLNNINNIAKLTITGKQPTNLTLNGKFSSLDSTLNLKLQPLTHLDIQLATPRSSLILETANAKKGNAIVLKELRILPNTQIEQLAYLPNTKQLKFCLQSSSQELNTCENLSPVESKPTSLGTLKFSVNPTAINLYLIKVKIPKLGIEEETLQETQLRWQPEGQDFILTLSAPTSLQIDFPKTVKTAEGNTTEDVAQTIRGNIPVKNVRFSKLDRTGNVSDDIETSEILEGEVRMMGQSLKLQPSQFLIIPTNRDFDKTNCRISPSENPGIQLLRDIRINTKSPQGLQTLFTGESKCLEIGLYERFPTQSIEPSWLLKYLPQEGINAIYTLIGAFTGILFPRLFPEKDNTKE
jgi:hypothetical protein